MVTVILWFIWTLIAFGCGALVHWMATRKQRRLLKLYRQQAQARRVWTRSVE
jgi:hypothetical protein